MLEEESYKEIMLKYIFAKKTLEVKLDCLVSEYELKNEYTIVEHVKSRIKSEESAIGKLKRKNLPITCDNLVKHVHDMIGIRIVCSFLADVYELVNLIKNSGQFKILDESDYIKCPKTSGYVSYHLNILVPIYWEKKVEYVEAEIQIRTVAMDFWASSDHKLRYKFPINIPEELENEMLICSNDIILLDKKMQRLYNAIKKYQE